MGVRQYFISNSHSNPFFFLPSEQKQTISRYSPHCAMFADGMKSHSGKKMDDGIVITAATKQAGRQIDTR